jgi:hypothetical protein
MYHVRRAINLFVSHGTAVAVFLAVLLVGPTLIEASGKHSEKAWWKLPVLHDPRPKYTLFSWAGPKHARFFALISNKNGSEEHRFIDKFDSRRAAGLNIAEIENRLSKLPSDCLVTWVRDAPHKLDYADPVLVRRIKRFAVKLKIDLQFNEMTYEDVGVGR